MSDRRQQPVIARIWHGDTHYVAECSDISVVTQGKTIDETVANLQEAVALHFDDVPGAFPRAILISLEVEIDLDSTA